MKLNYPRLTPVEIVKIVEQDIADGRTPDPELLAKIIRNKQQTPVIADYIVEKLASPNKKAARVGRHHERTDKPTITKTKATRGGRPKINPDRPDMTHWLIPATFQRVIEENPGINRRDALERAGYELPTQWVDWKTIARFLERKHGRDFWLQYKRRYWRPKKKTP